MTDNSDASPGAEKQRKRSSKEKQRASAAGRRTELREANEQLILAALHAETIAENAVTHLDELAHSSQHDALTGTPNRALMLDRMENAIAFANRHGTRIGVLFLDLDEFKQINDTLGHAVGDAVVQLVARHLESQVRQSDTVSRHGGDEFLVLLAEIEQPSDAALVAEKIIAALAVPTWVDNHLISLSASIGIALFPDDGTDAATLMSSADSAMYSCKRHGGSNFRFYSDAIVRARSLPSPSRETRHESSIAEQPSVERTLREVNEQLVLSALSIQSLEEQTNRKHARQVEFMALVAHELRNVLKPIKTAAGLLDRASAKSSMEDAHDALERQVAHMSRLVENLLVRARVASGDFRVAMSSVDIVEVLTRTVEAARPAFEARHQRLTMQLPPGPLLIQADAVRLAQIFCNLLDNASRYTPEGGQICLTGELANDSVVVTVSDNGMGFSPARSRSIFEVLVHDESRSMADGGLGIGLAVVHDLVEAHGGAIIARSPGENLGSEFSVTLPIRCESAVASPTSPS
jgi:diguanylate cyclase (GGDEF)-like protein